VTAFAVFLANAPFANADTEVNTCGQIVAGPGYLNADLTCTGMSGAAIILEPGATLDFRGHVLTSDFGGVICNASCTIESSAPGGTIRNCTGAAVTTEYQEFLTQVKISDLTLDGNRYGVGVQHTLVATNLTITNTEENALSGRDVRASNITIDGAGAGISGSSFGVLRVRDSTVRNAARGIGGYSLRVDRTTVTGATDVGISTSHGTIRDCHMDENPGTGIYVGSYAYGKVSVSDSTVNGNGGRGIDGTAKVILKNTSVADNGLEGVYTLHNVQVKNGSVISGNGLDGVRVAIHSICPRLSVRDSIVEGNGLDATCGISVTCADLSSCEKPLVGKTTCEHSYDTDSGFPGTSWDICSLD